MTTLEQEKEKQEYQALQLDAAGRLLAASWRGWVERSAARSAWAEAEYAPT